jgi:predicted metalloprotease with PDZ domain
VFLIFSPEACEECLSDLEITMRKIVSSLCVFLSLSGIHYVADAVAEPLQTIAGGASCGHRHSPFQGKIHLSVVATDTNHQIFEVRESIPVQSACPLSLLYPEWEPASHAPTASVADLAGLIVQADSQRIEWHRDAVLPHLFHLDLPRAAKSVEVEFTFLAPRSAALLRPQMVEVPWHRLMLYPAGYALADLPVDAELELPEGLHYFTAIDTATTKGHTVNFATTTMAALVDSPIYAGRYWLQQTASREGEVPIRLDVLADQAAQLSVPPDEETKLRNMITQARLVFGAAPFRHYDAIITLSDTLSPGGGVEHSEEGENNLPADYFSNISQQLMNRDLIVHEFVHAWNGRFRQPADLSTSTLNEPVGNRMLWVYEGQTEFWGRVLAARAGLRTSGETLDKLALDAAIVANRKGRAWKSLADSNYDPIYMVGHSVAWRDYQRREDYYPEGVLLWLDVDARLRELTKGLRGLDDFARLFFDTRGTVGTISTYTFEDICNALNTISKDDWATRLRRHLDSHDDSDAMAGLARAGWRLRYDDSPTESFRQDEKESGVINLDYSIGLQIRSDGTVRSVVWDSPAFHVGLAPGSRITGVNNQPFSLATLERTVNDASHSPLSLSFESDGTAQTKLIAYHGKLRYPHLERIPGTEDRLSPLLAAR